MPTDNSLPMFEQCMASHGLACPDPLVGDGRLHRYHGPNDKAGSKDCWYVFFDDESPVLSCGSWKTGERFSFSAKNQSSLSSAERHRYNERIAEAREIANEERRALTRVAALKAQTIWEHAVPAPGTFPYLLKKQIKPYSVRFRDGVLIVPAYGDDGNLSTLQFIDCDGNKKFLKDGAKRGSYFSIGGFKETIYICEGLSTGASIHAVTNDLTVIAFDSGNLLPVAQRIRKKYQNANIILGADNDCWKPENGNPGIEKATQAAQAVGGHVIFPLFQNPGDQKPTDFNDLQILEGGEAVRAQLLIETNDEPEGSPTDTQVNHWPEPIPLGNQRLPDFPTDIFPEWVGHMVDSVALSTETPRELAAALGLAGLATACQSKFEVEPEAGYIEPLNIWIVAAMESGNRKTAVLEAMIEPILSYEQEQIRHAIPKIKAIESERKTQEGRIKYLRDKAAKGGIEILDSITQEIKELEDGLPDTPSIPQLWAQDVTPEKLGRLMAEQGGVMSLLNDEGGLFETITGGRYNNGRVNLDLLLKSHSGSPVRIQRAGSDPVDLPRPLLTMGVSPQPEILHGLAQKPGFRGRGFLARFLFCLPQSQLGSRSLEPRPIEQPIRDAYSHGMESLLRVKRPEDGPYRLKLTEEAHREWKDFSLAVENDLNPGERFEHINDWAGKLPGAAARVAGLLHCGRHSHGEPWREPITIAAMEKALDFMSILCEHALEAFGVMAANPNVEKGRIILSWIQRKALRAFTQRDCHHSLRHHFPMVEDLKPGLKTLVERGFVRQAISSPNKNGRPSVEYKVNPKIINGGT